uniref:Pectinesterase n=1 Tax=Ananas comosus var. bracteatus TaxID=296719 RepID=A0A6V7PRH6_ANACO|nr:unnamed protein product [Ananas comosus var. bracteatus]
MVTKLPRGGSAATGGRRGRRSRATEPFLVNSQNGYRPAIGDGYRRRRERELHDGGGRSGGGAEQQRHAVRDLHKGRRVLRERRGRKNKTNIMFIGDGIGKTVIKAGRNVVDGWTTFRSATVAVVGNGFIARDLTIENSAGPSKHQAVALRTGADLSVFYRCSFVGYQDTLYVHSLRQFYRECDIYGTVDFIFGDGTVVLQSCNLYARKPDPNQNNVFTAQGREDPNQNTGISIQKCKVAAAADLIPVQSNFSTYLGRPWKQYSRTVYMQSFLDSLIDPAGWLPWNGTFALDTLYYGEYMNRGPGSNTTGRVQWPGHRVINSSDEATNFTVASFIQGDQWLGSVSIPFILGLN